MVRTLFVTCLAELMCPSVGSATIMLLEVAGCAEVPEGETCCRTGYRAERSRSLRPPREGV